MRGWPWWIVGVLVLLGAGGPAYAGSAETLEPSVAFVSRPASGELSLASATRYEVRRYRRTPPRRTARPIVGWATLRGGIFEGEDIPRDHWTIGGKVTGRVGEALDLGLSLDLHRRARTNATIVTEFTDPAGNRVTREIRSSETETNLVPLLAVAEVRFPAPGLNPYVGAGLGWQFLHVRVRDFESRLEYEDNYDGPGYQLYAGLSPAVARRTRMNLETYWNGGRVEQDVYDRSSGLTVEERIRTDGWGLRGGLSFAF